MSRRRRHNLSGLIALGATLAGCGAAPPSRHFLFANFAGGPLAPGRDNAAVGTSSIVGALGRPVAIPAFDWSLYGSDSASVIADVLTQVRAFYSDFDMDIVTARPSADHFVMAAVGGLPDLFEQPCSAGGCRAGEGPLDCRLSPSGPIYDLQGDVEAAFIFSDTARFNHLAPDIRRKLLATSIAHECGHTFGLGHSANPEDVMYPDVNGLATGFHVGSYPDVVNCAGSRGAQDAHAILLSLLGPR